MNAGLRRRDEHIKLRQRDDPPNERHAKPRDLDRAMQLEPNRPAVLHEVRADDAQRQQKAPTNQHQRAVREEQRALLAELAEQFALALRGEIVRADVVERVLQD